MITLSERGMTHAVLDAEYEALRREAVILNGEQYLLMAKYSQRQHVILEKMIAIETTRNKLQLS